MAKPRIWSIAMPFRADGWPVVVGFGYSIEPVIIMKVETWKRLCSEHPTLGATQFEVRVVTP